MIDLLVAINATRGLEYPYVVKNYLPIIKKFVEEGGDVKAILDNGNLTLLQIVVYRELENLQNHTTDEHNTTLFYYLIKNFTFTLNPLETVWMKVWQPIKDAFDQAQLELEKRTLLDGVDVGGLRELDDKRM